MVEQKKKKTVAVRIDDSSAAAIECSDGMLQVLSSVYNVRQFTASDVTPALFAGVDLIVIPGGVGEADDYWQYFPRHAGNAIADYVAQGGHYLGVCIGAYWADRRYIDLFSSDCIRVVQYIRQPTADIRRSYNTVANVIWEGERHNVYFRDGCTFIGDPLEYHTIATYANGQPMAIARNNIALIGGCLDSQLSWYQATPRLLPHWHGGRQHLLLLTVIDRLLQGKYLL